MENKTAVEWLISKIGYSFLINNCILEKSVIQHAIEMEKQQIIQAFEDGEINAIKIYYESSENYYSETFKK